MTNETRCPKIENDPPDPLSYSDMLEMLTTNAGAAHARFVWETPAQLRERAGIRGATEQDIAKAFRVPPWLIGTAPRPNWLRRNVQRWSGYRFWL